ncbi:YjbF family lipoprotein [Pseudorhodobacter sp.]|uniref:YjbF family lipoprotein n=1 Tax=Pseudorhodobacter sp. TaxID=1934400 RepID=UPI00264A44B2|nr:YjbF family lipoprotein [Pseudorhodobacter sp.]MDN5787351.1 YjbF family lipoprotein [Pseudorhodobacter sp.]
MTPRYRFSTALLFGFTALAVAACGSNKDALQSLNAAKSISSALLSPLKGKSKASPARLTRTDLDSIVTPVDVVTLESDGAQGVIAKIASNNGVETWSSVDNRTLALRDRVLVGTRGLTDDLMSASVPTPQQLSRDGTGFQRIHTTLTGDDQPLIQRFDCTVAAMGPETTIFFERSYQTRHFRESCTGSSIRFANDYWFDFGGRLRQSRQWVSTGVGFVVIQHLLK